MSFKKNYIVLSRDFTTPIASIFYKTSPEPIKVIVPLFRCVDEYGWKKRKSNIIWFNESDLEDLKKTYGEDLIVCRSTKEYKETMIDADLCISLGRETFLFKPLAKKNFAYSGMGEYISRYVDAIPHYKNLSIILDSPSWLDKSENQNFMQGSVFTESLEDKIGKSSNSFLFASPLLEYKNILDQIDKSSIKKELGVSTDKKIALISLRKADNWHTIYKNDDDFFKQCLKELKRFKKEGYYILCRRRTGVEDKMRRSLSSENKKYSELESLIDLEISTWGGYPDILYKLCHISDILILMDTSNLAPKEAGICELPVYSPYDASDNFNQSIEDWNPATRDMIRMGVMTNDLSTSFFKNYQKNIKAFKEKWHSSNLNSIWEIINRTK
tara:strand:- start:764 stop:1918 length:1155 start_codon:yes stop_codon:yes gene_type:complete